MPRENVARALQFGQQIGVSIVHGRVDLDHALRDLGLELSPRRFASHPAQQVIRVGRQIEIARVDEHQLELHADRERVRGREVELRHGAWVSRARPAQPAGLRGLQGFRFSLQTGETDQHSGTAGGAARNPVTELCQVISECVDGRTGRVKIPGFYADVVPPTKRELEDLKNCGFTTKDFKRDHMFRSLRVDDPLEIMKRVWMMPTFEVHGIAGGYQGPGVKTVIPPKATAIVSCRLVPNMNPKKIVRLVTEFVKGKNPDVKVSAEHELPAYQGKTTGPYADAIRGAMKFAFGKEPVFVREGGSIGAVLSMEKVFKSDVFFLGLSLPEHGYHAPNENFDWRQAEGGMAAFADYFRRVADLGKPNSRKRL